MAPPGGRRRAPRRRPAVPAVRIAGHALAALATGGAWVYLVRAAIDFGAMARDGRAVAWVFAALATLGAIGCLLLAIAVVTRALVALGLVVEDRPARAPARRRAK